jgi:hypothetical protein
MNKLKLVLALLAVLSVQSSYAGRGQFCETTCNQYSNECQTNCFEQND